MDAFPGTVTVNGDGSITVVSNADAPLGKYEVPVLVTYPDGFSETTPVKVTVQQPPVVGVDPQPSYTETVVPAGKTTTLTPTNSGDPIPSGTRWAIGGGFTAPSGCTITIAPATGVISVTVSEMGPNGAREEKVVIPVVVTYPDGSNATPDSITAVVNLDSDGDGIPDVTDPDDDNDGVSDDERTDGTDPNTPEKADRAGDTGGKGDDTKKGKSSRGSRLAKTGAGVGIVGSLAAGAAALGGFLARRRRNED